MPTVLWVCSELREACWQNLWQTPPHWVFVSPSVMWMYCFQLSSTRAISFISEGGNACGRICFGVDQGPGEVGHISMGLPLIHSSVTPSRVMHCSGLTEGQLYRDAYCLLELALPKGLTCMWSLQRNRWPCIPLTTSPARRWVTRRREKSQICSKWLLQRIHIPGEQCLYAAAEESVSF